MTIFPAFMQTMGTRIQRFWQCRPLYFLLALIFLLTNLDHTCIALNNVQSVQYLIRNFNSSRSSEDGIWDSKRKARNLIKEILDKQGYKTETQAFSIDGVSGTNVIGRKDGSFVNTINDRILIIGAYYDTYKTSPGVNAGGSGLAAMLHIARQYSDKDQTCEQNHTIVFVAFDQSQHCTCGNFSCCYYGSKYFIKQFTNELGQNKGRGEIEGAIILGSILNFDPSQQSQNFSKELKMDVDRSVRDVVAAVGQDGNRGDFILSIGRQDGDTYLLKNFTKYYNQGSNYARKFKLREFTWALQEQPDRLGSKAKRTYRDLFNGDHYSFWNNDPMVKAIFLSDTADLRGYMKYCYRNSCDNSNHLTPTRGQFMANVADTVAIMARNLTRLGKCTITVFGNISRKLFGESGEITSPGFPKRYPNKADSVWYITVPVKYSSVIIQFSEFELEENECTNDFVDIYDGFSDNLLLGHFCGKAPPFSPPQKGIRTKTRYMKVVFKSDSFDTYKGFKAQWKAQGTLLQGLPLFLLAILSVLVHIWT